MKRERQLDRLERIDAAVEQIKQEREREAKISNRPPLPSVEEWLALSHEERIRFLMDDSRLSDEEREARERELAEFKALPLKERIRLLTNPSGLFGPNGRFGGNKGGSGKPDPAA